MATGRLLRALRATQRQARWLGDGGPPRPARRKRKEGLFSGPRTPGSVVDPVVYGSDDGAPAPKKGRMSPMEAQTARELADGTRGLRLIAVLVSFWTAVYAIGNLLIEYTPLPQYLPTPGIRVALNNDFERARLRVFRQKLATEQIVNDTEQCSGCDPPFPATLALYRDAIVTGDHSPEGLKETYRDAGLPTKRKWYQLW
ncbi:hypothetical protein DIPPA_32415 [Diplonema papillatum]|nr:hypothetical protein DIPPA_32415 [Diplonema papillatum]